MSERICNVCGQEMDSYGCLNPAHAFKLAETLKAENKALEDLREMCGMYCEQLPFEVREVLHKTPEIEKVHRCGFEQFPKAKPA